MSETINFTSKDRDGKMQCRDGEVKQILEDGVLNPNHSDWIKLPTERQKEILDTLLSCTVDAKDAIAQLKTTIVSGGNTVSSANT